MLKRYTALFMVLALAWVMGCSSRRVIEEKTLDANALKSASDYYVRPITFSFKPPADWEIEPSKWNEWKNSWEKDFNEEIRNECYKSVKFVGSDSAVQSGVVVTCDVYDMDKGGWAGWGGVGWARASIVMKDAASGKVLYEGKLQGDGSNSGFESNTVGGRLKFGIINVARQIADLAETGN
ncbi:MAG: hypothetical protein IT463_07700 [Planctomycetes bacterium]|nr:hypothetical protein [Planctomycetota bacterium]